MSGVRERFLSDARKQLTQQLDVLRGRNDLDEVFAAWVLSGRDGFSLSKAADEAASSALKNYRSIAILGFARTAQGFDFQHTETLRKALGWLAGRSDSVAGSPAGFTTDAIALLGIALGTHHIGDASSRKAVGTWMNQFIITSCSLRSVLDWERCLFAVAGKLVDCPTSIPIPDNDTIADVRVTLRSHNLLPPTHKANTDADEEQALALILATDQELSLSQATLRAAAFDSLKQGVQSLSESHRFLLQSKPSSDKSSEVSMSGKPTTKVFLQYTWDSDTHQQRVVSLANSLRNTYGFDAMMDVFVPGMPPEGLPHWMLGQIELADYVLVICTENNKRRWEGHEPTGKGKGAKWEGGLITRILYLAELQNSKFIPVVFERDDLSFIPLVLSGAIYYDLSSATNFEGLFRHLSKQPAYVPAPLGHTPVLSPRDVKPFRPGS